jgi:hypothetical protein
MPGARGVIVADTGNNAIREISLQGEGNVRTLPGGRWCVLVCHVPEPCWPPRVAAPPPQPG